MISNFDDKTVIIIPIRMASSRLPGKFHADISGKPMIHHVIDRARETNLTNIVIACDHPDHFKLVEDYNAKAIMTGLDHQSGSDRSYEALQLIDPNNNFEYIINLQGDIPFVAPETILSVVLELYKDPTADISTMIAPFHSIEDVHNPNYVKAIFDNNQHALYFSRSPIPFSAHNSPAEYYHHIGIYAYHRSALEKYVNLPPSRLEISEKLEQLRALENGMKIRVGLTNDTPISVDVPDDLNNARMYALQR